jgi:hypothetical protein
MTNKNGKNTSIIVSKETWKRLNNMRECGVSFEYTIISLLDKYDSEHKNLNENKKL